jgi:predicted dehydrogenase
MGMSKPLQVGIVGARGIGRHQAKWFSRCGCEVVAVYGRTPESCAQAEAALRNIYDFRGEVTSDWSRFVADDRFQVASICSPAEAHAEQAIALLRAGKDVLCEKPLVWYWDSDLAKIVVDGERVVAAARESGRILAVNAQYPAGVAAYLDLYGKLRGGAPRFESLSFIMETKGKPRSDHLTEIWVDLGPHAFALLDAMLPGGIVEPEGEEVTLATGRTRAAFIWSTPQRRARVTFDLGRVTGDTFVRRFGADGLMVDYEGRNHEGEFVAVLRCGDQEWVGEDFMRASIRRFVEAVQARDPSRVLVSGEAALRHLREQVAVCQRHPS